MPGMFTARQYEKAEYPLIASWWDGHKVQATPAEILPACGIVIEAAGVPSAAAWIYFDNSVGVAWLAWVVTRPGLTAKFSEQVLAELLEAVEISAKAQKRTILITMCRASSLAKWFLRHGFLKNHGCVFDLVKPLA